MKLLFKFLLSVLAAVALIASGTAATYVYLIYLSPWHIGSESIREWTHHGANVRLPLGKHAVRIPRLPPDMAVPTAELIVCWNQSECDSRTKSVNPVLGLSRDLARKSYGQSARSLEFALTSFLTLRTIEARQGIDSVLISWLALLSADVYARQCADELQVPQEFLEHRNVAGRLILCGYHNRSSLAHLKLLPPTRATRTRFPE